MNGIITKYEKGVYSIINQEINEFFLILRKFEEANLWRCEIFFMKRQKMFLSYVKEVYNKEEILGIRKAELKRHKTAIRIQKKFNYDVACRIVSFLQIEIRPTIKWKQLFKVDK